jgi:hypothetical protein
MALHGPLPYVCFKSAEEGKIAMIRDTISAALKDAMKARNEVALVSGVLRPRRWWFEARRMPRAGDRRSGAWSSR